MTTSTTSLRHGCTVAARRRLAARPADCSAPPRAAWPALWFDGQKHHPGRLAAPATRRHPLHRRGRRWLDAYWRRPATTPLRRAARPARHAFQRAVWQALLRSRAGRTRTYGEIARARRLGRGGARASARRSAATRCRMIVPCHRVIGRDGSLTGYAGGLHAQAGAAAARRRARSHEARDERRRSDRAAAARRAVGRVVPVHAPGRGRVRAGGAGRRCAWPARRCCCCRCCCCAARRPCCARTGGRSSSSASSTRRCRSCASRYAALSITAGLSSIFNATAPLFGAVDRLALAEATG